MKVHLKKKEKVKIKKEKIKLKKKKTPARTNGLGWEIVDFIIEILECIFEFF